MCNVSGSTLSCPLMSEIINQGQGDVQGLPPPVKAGKSAYNLNSIDAT